jgi:hypothetical protein
MVKHYPNLQDTVHEMWLLDAVNQGDSAIINEGYLGDVCRSNVFDGQPPLRRCIADWADHARDLQQFLLYYMPEKVEARLPIHLIPLSKHTCESRRVHGFEHRTLIVVGHSYSGTTT